MLLPIISVCCINHLQPLSFPFIFVTRKVLSPASPSLQKSAIDRKVKRLLHCDSLAESAPDNDSSWSRMGGHWGAVCTAETCCLAGKRGKKGFNKIAQWPEAAALGNGAVFIARCI